MRLTAFTDYSLRVLIFLAAQPENKLSNIKEISKTYNLSNNHLSKVVYELGKLGLITTIRGRNGGIKLEKKPNEINIGWLVRKTEDDFQIAECFNKEKDHCIISASCGMKFILQNALNSYLNVLDSYYLSDIIQNKNKLFNLLSQKEEVTTL